MRTLLSQAIEFPLSPVLNWSLPSVLSKGGVRDPLVILLEEYRCDIIANKLLGELSETDAMPEKVYLNRTQAVVCLCKQWEA